ncbi:MAG: 5-formyltetrahydrofolate cyclo-ligase [Erysipelotrichaceae bacterium]|nr:5-formyltetrahydrofolate cyclo-ligase [Erysipelotrichaceae bacterium]
MDKKETRKRFRKLRRELKDKKKRSSIITEKLLATAEIRRAKTVAVYCSTEDEVRTDELIEELLKEKKKVAVPLVNGKDMVFIMISSLEELVNTGSFGIREPLYSKEKTVDAEDIDVAIFPGLAFDRKRNRLGYGGGYYDRYFKDHTAIIKIAPAFNCQVSETIPHDENDLKVDRIITEKEDY